MTITTLYATEDTYVDEAVPNTNYGNGVTLYCASRNLSRNKRYFVKFNISSLAGKIINSAKLRVYCTLGVTKRTYEYRRCTQNLAENAITWNNQPTITDTNGINQAAPAISGWHEVLYLEEMVKDGLSDGYIWIRVKDYSESESDTNYQTTYRSREYDTLDPELVVDWSEPVAGIVSKRLLVGVGL